MPESVEIRPFVASDQDPIRAIWLNASAAGEQNGFEVSSIERIVERLPVDPEGVFVAARDNDVLGFLDINVHLVVVRHDVRRRGIGRALVEAAERSLLDVDDARLLLWLPDLNEPATRLYDAIGLVYQTSLWQLDLPKDWPVPEPMFPAELEQTIPDRIDIDAYVDLLNVAFVGHPTPLQVTRDVVEWAHSRPEFDPTFSLVLIERSSGRLIGFCRTGLEPASPALGDVKLIGLLPEWRGRGLGRSLLAWGVHRLRRAGATDISLTVEGENEGAVSLYKQSGFVESREWRRFGRASE